MCGLFVRRRNLTLETCWRHWGDVRRRLDEVWDTSLLQLLYGMGRLSEACFISVLLVCVWCVCGVWGVCLVCGVCGVWVCARACVFPFNFKPHDRSNDTYFYTTHADAFLHAIAKLQKGTISFVARRLSSILPTWASHSLLRSSIHLTTSWMPLRWRRWSLRILSLSVFRFIALIVFISVVRRSCWV